MNNDPFSFSLDEDQIEKFKEWSVNHDCNIPNTAIGGNITFEFSPNSIGLGSGAKCVCGAEIDLTDYNW